MKRKWLTVIILLLFIEIITIPTTAQYTMKQLPKSRGNWLYVGGSGPGNYTNIQDAVEDASNGDTVFVFSRLYMENIYVNKSITFIGENKNTTIVDGKKVGDVFFIVSDNVTITGFTIRKCGGIVPIGIYIRSDHNTIVDNIIKDNPDGIWLWDGSSYNNIQKNILINNSDNGIHVYRSSKNHITSNSIRNSEDGIYLFIDANENFILNNSIENCSQGIYIQDSSYHTVMNNSIKNSDAGIYAVDTSHNIFFNNIITDCYCGMWFHCCSNSSITRNFIANNNQALYLKTESSNNEISYNVIEKNIKGIYLWYSSNDNNITYNAFLHNFRNVFFSDSFNRWDANYWERSRILPKWILGGKTFTIPFLSSFYLLPWFEFDWHPAQEPYDVGG
jgi:parallel beta-helix repeat protein